tara:strand:- start:89 stop:508 length:420 start_codon:yes stop_codon:yes gene_type:complete
MVDNFNNIYILVLFIFACIFTPGFYAAVQLWESKKVLKRYGIDESATLIARFAACWPTAEALVAILILFIGPQGNWAFFTFGCFVFGASTIYNTLSYFNIALTLGRGKYKVLPEAMYASIFKLGVYSILLYSLSDKLFL